MAAERVARPDLGGRLPFDRCCLRRFRGGPGISQDRARAVFHGSRLAWLVVRGFVPSDFPAGGTGCGDGGVGVDSDLVGVGFYRGLNGLAGVGQADPELLPADHDRPAYEHPPGHRDRFRQGWPLRCSGACPAQPGPGSFRDGAGDRAGRNAAGQDVGDRAVQSQSE
jgi:hypothetical protein